MMSIAYALPTEATSEPASAEIGIYRPTAHKCQTTGSRGTQSSQPPTPGHKATLFPAGYRPEGVALAHVPQEIRRRVETALPQEGEALLAHLLRFATMRPRQHVPASWAALAEEEDNERRAWVLAPSLEALARSPNAPCGPDRYYHLIIVLEALHVLRRRVRRIRHTPASYVTVLSLCLDPPVTPLSIVLHTCREMEQAYANRRVKRLLVQARERLQRHSQPTEELRLSHLLAQMQQLAEWYQEQGLPQAPLLSLLAQMFACLLPAQERQSHPSRVSTRLVSFPLQQPLQDERLDPSEASIQHQSDELPSSHADSVVSFPDSTFLLGTGSFVPQPCANQPQNPYSFVPNTGTNQPRCAHVTGPSACEVWQDHAQTGHRTPQMGRFVPPADTNLPANVSINDSFLQERIKETKEKTLIDTINAQSCNYGEHQASPVSLKQEGRAQVFTQASRPPHRTMPAPGTKLPQHPQPKAECVATQADKVGTLYGNQVMSDGQTAAPASHLEQAASLSPCEGSAPLSRQDAISTYIPGQALSENTQPPEMTASTVHSGTRSHLEMAASPSQESGVTASRDQEAIRREASTYARLFDGQDAWIGNLIRCVQHYPAHVRRLAAINTLYHLYSPDWHGKPQRPGAWFCRTCERIDQGTITLSESVQRWAATDLDYETIAAALQRGEHVPGQEGIWEWGRSTAHPSGGKQATPFQVPMDRQMVERLAKRIREEVAIDTYRSQVQIKEGRSPGTWIVRLLWEDGVEVPIENEAAWEEYWTGAQECLAIQAKYAQ